MSRYDDRYRGSDRRDDRGGGGGYRGGGGGGRGGDAGPDAGGTRLYVGRLSTRTRSRDLEDLFAKYGRYGAFHLNQEPLACHRTSKRDVFALLFQSDLCRSGVKEPAARDVKRGWDFGCRSTNIYTGSCFLPRHQNVLDILSEILALQILRVGVVTEHDIHHTRRIDTS